MFVPWAGVRLLERWRETEAALSAPQTIPKVLGECRCSALTQTYIPPGDEPARCWRPALQLREAPYQGQSCQHCDTLAVGNPQLRQPNTGDPISSWDL